LTFPNLRKLKAMRSEVGGGSFLRLGENPS
jgi:hypothetical protein